MAISAKSQMSHICENIGYKNDGWRYEIFDDSSNNNLRYDMAVTKTRLARGNIG